MVSLDFLDDVQRMNKQQLYYQVLHFGKTVSSALMLWKGLTVITGSESPIAVVHSSSMERAFHRGDFLFPASRVEDHPVGVEEIPEIVVFRIEGREVPIVHRVLKIHEKGFVPYIGVMMILMNDCPKFPVCSTLFAGFICAGPL
ncbi:signal peptidase complex catalytic subunit SEC11A-like isoform X2 [Mesoplodon densirostris]|uniref:signal peptidase complex catalytic subunit SEC11A-like isoform X2 n=1 Tax=Mesoplodon densirostris TaxID=48708 RepID=UPI0028DC2B05|nr:signal peptidase complex catalytic subunit SEC11A-like isoform X2 [Mesoplodon densirostris]